MQNKGFLKMQKFLDMKEYKEDNLINQRTRNKVKKTKSIPKEGNKEIKNKTEIKNK